MSFSEVVSEVVSEGGSEGTSGNVALELALGRRFALVSWFPFIVTGK